MYLRGRPRGRDQKQEHVWSENEEKIVYALMDKYPNSARLNYLERETGLTRQAICKHLRSLELDNIIKEEDKTYRLNPVYHYEEVGKILYDKLECNVKNIEGILVIRVQADSPILCQICFGNNTYQNTGISIASTIPFTSMPTIKITPTQIPTNINYQIMTFKWRNQKHETPYTV